MTGKITLGMIPIYTISNFDASSEFSSQVNWVQINLEEKNGHDHSGAKFWVARRGSVNPGTAVCTRLSGEVGVVK